MAKQASSFDFLLNTIPNPHDVNPYLSLLKRDATMVLVGALTALEPPLVGRQPDCWPPKTLAGSVIGGMPETQEMIDFCAAHDIVSDVEVIPMRSINEAVRAAGEERCPLPLRDRHGVAEIGGRGGIPRACVRATRARTWRPRVVALALHSWTIARMAR